MNQQEAKEVLSKEPFYLSHKQKSLILQRQTQKFRGEGNWSERMDFLIQQFQLVSVMTDDECEKEFWRLFNGEDEPECGEAMLASHEAMRQMEQADISGQSVMEQLGDDGEHL